MRQSYAGTIKLTLRSFDELSGSITSVDTATPMTSENRIRTEPEMNRLRNAPRRVAEAFISQFNLGLASVSNSSPRACRVVK